MREKETDCELATLRILRDCSNYGATIHHKRTEYSCTTPPIFKNKRRPNKKRIQKKRTVQNVIQKLNRANRALKAEQPMNKKMMVGTKRIEVKNADKNNNNTSKYS